MKQTTKDWLIASEDDLLSAKKLFGEERLTNILAFHCQQCLEKLFKAVIEEKTNKALKSHDLIRLKEMAEITLSDSDIVILATINEVYIDARYPAEFGLMPNGKPTMVEADQFIQFTEKIFKIYSKL